MSQCHLHPDVEQPCWQCGVNRVRSAIAVAPKPPRSIQATTTAHELALARARAEKGRKP